MNAKSKISLVPLIGGILIAITVYSQEVSKIGLTIKKDISPAILAVLEHHDFTGPEHLQRLDNIRTTIFSPAGPASIDATWDAVVTALISVMGEEDKHLVAMHFLTHECDYNEAMSLYINNQGELLQAMHSKHFFDEKNKVSHWQLNENFKKMLNISFSSTDMANRFLSTLGSAKVAIGSYESLRGPSQGMTAPNVIQQPGKKTFLQRIFR